jgi:hypothetical protein
MKIIFRKVQMILEGWITLVESEFWWTPFLKRADDFYRVTSISHFG